MDKKRIVLDTNIFIVGYTDVESEAASPESKIVEFLIKSNEYVLLLSNELEEQILRVARRLKNKEWAGFLRFLIWRDFEIEHILLPTPSADLIVKYKEIPTKDIPIFITALIGKTDCMISNNRVFAKEAAKKQNLFKCYSAEEFVEQEIDY